MSSLRRQSLIVLGFGLPAISSSSILTKLCAAPPLTIALYRVVIASAIYFILAGAKPKLYTKQQIKTAALAGLFLAFHFAFWITSLNYTSVASSVVLVVTSPIWVAIGGMIFLREKPSLSVLAAVAVTLIGSLIVSGFDLALDARRLTGNVLALLGAVAAAGYWLVGRRMRAEMDTFPYVAIVYGACALFTLIPITAFRVPVAGFSLQTHLFLVSIALVPQIIGHTSLNWALKHFSATTVSVITLGEPVGASILAWLILGERLTLLQIFGGAVIIAGVSLALLAEKRINNQKG